MASGAVTGDLTISVKEGTDGFSDAFLLAFLVVETFFVVVPLDLPVVFLVVAFFAVVFLAAFFVTFWAVVFLPAFLVAFLAVLFLAAFLVAFFLPTDFLVAFFLVAFFADFFLAADFLVVFLAAFFVAFFGYLFFCQLFWSSSLQLFS